jgi:xanthine dehydrogenase accessory factor
VNASGDGTDPPEAGTWDSLVAALRSEIPVALATVISGPHVGSRVLVSEQGRIGGVLPDADLDRVVLRDAVGELAAGRTGLRHYGEAGQTGEEVVTVFIESFAAPPEMLVFGAMDFTGALVRVAKVLGYRVTVCDAREVFATTQRFPQADGVVVDWPHRLLESVGSSLGPRDAICVLTHDARFDVPALMAALGTDVGYIGAMGSRRTHEDRIRRLRDAGATEADLGRIHAPIGLDVGARTPEETAISICAEVIAVRTGRPAGRLGDSTGPIH